MRYMGRSIAGTVLAVGMVFAQPGFALAATGQAWDVVTDKETYYRSEPIRVMAKFTNGSDTSRGFFPWTGFSVRVVLLRLKSDGNFDLYYGPYNLTQVNPNYNASVVKENSSCVLAQTSIPAYALQSGLYDVELLINDGASGTIARPWKVIQVK